MPWTSWREWVNYAVDTIDGVGNYAVDTIDGVG